MVYDASHLRGAVSTCHFAAASFDYVVSLDVLGHVEAQEKDGCWLKVRARAAPWWCDAPRHRVYRQLRAEDLTTK